jgi:Dehydrogenases with different specificities (related to short-chain alcohol dehydrogenases)
VDIWDRELGVHAKGVFLGTRTAIPAMRKGGGGSIINTSSVMGIVGSPTSPAYSAAKGAITIFTKSAALQYAKENIRINSVHPGYADTPLTRSASAIRPCARLLDRTPMGGSAPPRISPMACCSWRPTNHPGSPARNW